MNYADDICALAELREEALPPLRELIQEHRQICAEMSARRYPIGKGDYVYLPGEKRPPRKDDNMSARAYRRTR